MMYLGRLEYLPFGIFKDDYSEVDFDRDSKPKLSIGMSYAYLQEAPGNRGILGSASHSPVVVSKAVDAHNASADVMFKMLGFSFQTEWFWREFTNVTKGRNGWGAMAQLGYLLPRTGWEVAARYGVIRGNGTITNLPDEDELGVAVSHYFAHHNLKIQADVFRLYDPVAFSTGETQVRIQMQAAF